MSGKAKKVSKEIEEEDVPGLDIDSDGDNFDDGDSEDESLEEIEEPKVTEEKPKHKVVAPKIAKAPSPKAKSVVTPAKKAAPKAKLPTLRLLQPSPSPMAKTTAQIPLISGFQNPRTGNPQEVLQQLLVKGENEDETTFQQRKLYSEAALKYAKSEITPETAVVLGEIMIKKAKYDVSYSEPIEKVLGIVNNDINKKVK